MAVQLGKSDSYSNRTPFYCYDMLSVSANIQMPNRYIGCSCADTPCALIWWNTNYMHVFQEVLLVQCDICFSYCSVRSCLLAFSFVFSSPNWLWLSRKVKIARCAPKRWVRWTLSVWWFTKSLEDVQMQQQQPQQIQILPLSLVTQACKLFACKQALYWGCALLVNEASVRFKKAADSFCFCTPVSGNRCTAWL